MSECRLCPRLCGRDRSKGERGYCNEGETIRVARIAPHNFEEPPISGTRGSGTVFFVGCSLGCEFCQNKDISRGGIKGREIGPAELSDTFLKLQERGVHNINLVTPTHFADGVREALETAKPRLTIPVVYNTSGYERVETLKSFEGLVDIYLPDLKYASSELARKYSHAPDYPQIALSAIAEMYRQVGKYEFDGDGLLKRGVVVRHLVLPSARADSMAALRTLAETLSPKDILLSLMSQYTPEFALESQYKELKRRVTTFEYESVLKCALELGFEGFMQGRTSSTDVYTPNFQESGII